MHQLPACPICHQPTLTDALACRDHIASGETFVIQRCTTCSFMFTNPRPGKDQLPKYYQSNAYVSHAEKAESLTDKLYRTARAFTLKWKYNLLKKYSLVPPQSLLDFGCGTGDFLQLCQKRGIQISGVEPSPEARRVAAKRTGKQIHADLSSLNERVDAITLWHVLEHVADLDITVDHLKDRLAENGTMFIAVPNHRSADATRYREHWAAYDVPRHLWHFNRTTMAQLLNNHGLTNTDTHPMRLDAYYVSLLSENYKTGKTGTQNMLRALQEGLQSNKAAAKTGEYSSIIYIVRK